MQPPGYTPTTTFQSEEANAVAGRSTVRTPAIDVEFQNLNLTLDAVLVNLSLIQRDDGEIRDGTVKLHTLASEVVALMASANFSIRGVWATATDYIIGDIVSETASPYLCIEAHTGGVFATDLAADKWVLLRAAAAASISFSPTADIIATNAQAAIEEVDADLRPWIRVFQYQTFGGL